MSIPTPNTPIVPQVTLSTPPMTDEAKYGYEQINNIIKCCEQKSTDARCKANTFRIFNIGISLLIIICGVLATAILAMSDSEDYITIALTAIITLVQTIHEIFRIGQRGVYYKYASIRLRSLLRLVREDVFKLSSGLEMIRYAHRIQKEIDDLDLNMFKLSYGPESVKYNNEENNNETNDTKIQIT